MNYPWVDYGWDFGLAPPPWRVSGANPCWYVEIDQHLRFFCSLGITVVRWFILADGLTYGTGLHAPRLDTTSAQGWRFEPTALNSAFLQHFHELLGRFSDANKNEKKTIQLLPVLIDFNFCYPGNPAIMKPDSADPSKAIADPDWIKQGRADAITDASKRATFLDEVLDALLGASQEYKDVIYAWELINEPEWITNGWHPDGLMNHPVDENSMRAFLKEGKQRIRRAGFKPTIGFNTIDTLLKSKITCDINQFHHYPDGSRTLAKHTFNPHYPGIIGEFATSAADVWPELVAVGQTLLNRLRLVESLGYPLAIPWSFRQKDRHTAWSADSARDVECFTRKQD